MANKAEEPSYDSFIGSLISSQAHHSSSYFPFDRNTTLKAAGYYHVIEFSFTSSDIQRILGGNLIASLNFIVPMCFGENCPDPQGTQS